MPGAAHDTLQGWPERERALAKLDTWAPQHELPLEPFISMEQAVITPFADKEREGEPD